MSEWSNTIWMFRWSVGFSVEYCSVFHLGWAIAHWETTVASVFSTDASRHASRTDFDRAIERSKTRRQDDQDCSTTERILTVLSLSSSWNVQERERSEPRSAVTRFGWVRPSARKKQTSPLLLWIIRSMSRSPIRTQASVDRCWHLSERTPSIASCCPI